MKHGMNIMPLETTKHSPFLITYHQQRQVAMQHSKMPVSLVTFNMGFWNFVWWQLWRICNFSVV